MFPPIPPWQGFHPLVIHFPIGLLLAAPVLVLISMLVHKHRLAWGSAALALIVMGTLGIYVAAMTGEAAEEGADFPEGIDTVLNRHEQLATISKFAFTGLTIVYAGWLLWNRRRQAPLGHVPFMAATFVYLAFYGGGALVLANTAHNGGRLVHEFGVKAVTAETVTSQPATAPAEKPAGKEND